MMHFNARISAREFGFLSDRTVLGFRPDTCPTGARLIKPDPDYTFAPDFFERLRLWWEWSDTSAPLYISGPAGCGKTSAILQFLARVNAPCVTLTCRRRMDKYELVGQWGADPVTNSLCWTDGPALTAWRHGAVLVINEMTSAPADVWVSANDILEGDDIVVDRTGEIVARHPNTRVVFTDNRPLGNAEETPQYLGRNAQDTSVLDRCWHIAADYADEATEVALLLKKTRANRFGLTEARAEAIAAEAVRFARATRVQAQDAASLGIRCAQISTRSLVRFTELLYRFAATPAIEMPVTQALRLTITDALSTEAAATLQNAMQFDFRRLNRLVAGK